MNKTALITGASKGIGAELAKEFAQHQHHLVLTARDEAALNKLAQQLQQDHGVEVSVIIADLSDPQGVTKLLAELDQRQLTINYLVNNAGLGFCSDFKQTPLATIKAMMQVNIHALTELCYQFIQRCPEGEGKILNVGSIAAFQPGPQMATYYASKAFVHSFSQALAEELSGSKITVTCLYPGPTETPFIEAANMQRSLIGSGTIGLMSANKVARMGYQAMMKGRRSKICGLMNTVVAFLGHLSPKFISMKMVKLLHR